MCKKNKINPSNAMMKVVCPMLILLFTVLFATKGVAQESMLSAFYAEASHGKVVLSWTLKTGGTCNGIDIFHSLDSIHFQAIGDIAGECGDLSSPKSYVFTDAQPDKNKINYYRLQLGSKETSQVLAVAVIAIDDLEVLIQPNPATEQVTLLFSNDNHQEIELLVYAQQGHVVERLQGTGSFFLLDTSKWPSEKYFFVLRKKAGLEQRSGSFMVIH